MPMKFWRNFPSAHIVLFQSSGIQRIFYINVPICDVYLSNGLTTMMKRRQQLNPTAKNATKDFLVTNMSLLQSAAENFQNWLLTLRCWVKFDTRSTDKSTFEGKEGRDENLSEKSKETIAAGDS